MNDTPADWKAREKRHKLQSLCVAIDYNITALSLIPEYLDNQSIRSVHERELERSIEGIKELLK